MISHVAKVMLVIRIAISRTKSSRACCVCVRVVCVCVKRGGVGVCVMQEVLQAE